MKHLKLLGLAAVAAMALMAFAGVGTASATEICTTNSFPCPAGNWEIKALELSKDPNTSMVLEDTSGSIQQTCIGATASSAVTQGDSTHTVVLPHVSLGFTECTKTTTVNNEATCEFEAHGITGTTNATITARGCTVTYNLGVSCKYGAGAGIDLGAFTGGGKTLAINTVVEGIDGNSFLCPTTLRWTAWYVVTNHNAVYFHP